MTAGERREDGPLRTWPTRDEFRQMSPVEVNEFFKSIGSSWRVVAPAPREDGTETHCQLEGVHEHVFRGPHRFREWEPGT